MEMTGFPPTLYLSGAWDPSQQPAIQAEFAAIRGLTSLSRVHELFAASLDGAKDRLRAFQAGWSALEIFVNKVFSRYERDFLGGLTSDSDPNAKEWFVARIHEVMRDKYRLRDRFALIAGVLASSDADADVAEFDISENKARRFGTRQGCARLRSTFGDRASHIGQVPASARYQYVALTIPKSAL